MPNPWMIIGVICVVLGTYKYGSYSGHKQRDQEMQIEIAKLNEESRAKEQKLAEDLNQTSSQLKEANDVVTKKQTDLDAAIRAGRVRLGSSSSGLTHTGIAPDGSLCFGGCSTFVGSGGVPRV